MSFTEKVKTELCGAAFPARLNGVFRSGILYGLKADKPLTTDNAEVRDLLRRIFGNAAESDCFRQRNKETYRFSFHWNNIGGDPFAEKNGWSGELPAGDDASVGIFLRGVFLSCGTVSVLKSGYHLELALYSEQKCGCLFRLINEQGMRVKQSFRRGIPFLYTKDSENIADFLTFIGAMQSAMEIMNIKIYKGLRSNVNRAVNCEAANLEKTVAASAAQIEQIRLIEAKKGLCFLPPELSALARARLENPDVSLSELGKLLDPPISRSGVNHRLERLKKIAEELQ